MKREYITRLAENELQRKLKSTGCVVVGGPKFCGKSTMCSRFAESKIELKTTNDILLAKSDPRAAIVGENPRLIDEWQKAPEIWNIIRSDLDDDYRFGKYILTGSTTPVDSSVIEHSGAGRISGMILKPFTLFESGESNGTVSLKKLFEQENDPFHTSFYQENDVSLRDIAFLLCRGGWPVSLMADKEYAVDVTVNYFDGLFTSENESDEFAEFLKNKDIELLLTILRSYARNISTQSKRSGMIADILASGTRKTLDEDTFNVYSKVLKDLHIIYDLPAWSLNLRTSVSVRTAPTHHFIDTSIATAALGINPDDLLNDLKSFGYFFEDMAVRDLSVYAGAFRGKLKHYRDSSGQEVDAIIELPNSEYGAVEIKITSETNIREGIKSLLAFEKKMASSNLKLPAFKMVLTSHGACYRSKEGVYVVPITFLKD